MNFLKVSGFAITAALSTACGSSGDKPPPLPNGGVGGYTGRGGKSGIETDAGDAGDAAPNDGGQSDVATIGDDGGLLGPQVTITSPATVTDPDVGPVLVNDGVAPVEVVCTALPGDGASTSAVSASTVSIEM